MAVANWLLCALVVVAEMYYGAHSGRSLRLWLLLAFVLGTFQFASDLVRLEDGHDTRAAIRMAAYGPLVILGLLSICETDTPTDDAYRSVLPPDETAEASTQASTPTAKIYNEEATASFWSRVTFSWISPILQLGATRALEQSDLYELQTRDGTQYQVNKLSNAWAAEVSARARARSNQEHPLTTRTRDSLTLRDDQPRAAQRGQLAPPACSGRLVFIHPAHLRCVAPARAMAFSFAPFSLPTAATLGSRACTRRPTPRSCSSTPF